MRFIKIVIIVALCKPMFGQICPTSLPYHSWFKKYGPVRDETLNISENNNTVVLAANRHIFLHDQLYGDIVEIETGETILATCLNYEGTVLVTSSRSTLSIYNVKTKELTDSSPIPSNFNSLNIINDEIVGVIQDSFYRYSLIGEKIESMSFSQHGSPYLVRKVRDWIVAISIEKEKEDMIIFYDLKTKSVNASYKVDYDIYDFKISPDGRYLAINANSDDDYFVEVLEVATFDQYYRYEASDLYRNLSVSFSPDSKFLAVANSSRAKGVRIFDLEKKLYLGGINIGDHIRIHYKIDGVYTVQFGRKSSLLYVGVYDAVRKFELRCINH